jgi:hypothetical protein
MMTERNAELVCKNSERLYLEEQLADIFLRNGTDAEKINAVADFIQTYFVKGSDYSNVLLKLKLKNRKRR